MRAKLDVEPGEIDQDTAVGFAIGLQTPLREVIVDTDEDIAGNNTVGVGRRRARGASTRACSRPRAPAARSGDYPGPGVWYPSLYLISNQRRPAKVEFPVEFELEVIGDPQPDASPEPTPAKATPAPEPEGEDGGGTSGGAIAGIGLAGLLVGLVGGGLAARRC